MPSFVKLVTTVAFILLVRLLTGGGCTKTGAHPSGNAWYVRDESCTVSAQVSNDEFLKLLKWCETKHQEEGR